MTKPRVRCFVGNLEQLHRLFSNDLWLWLYADTSGRDLFKCIIAELAWKDWVKSRKTCQDRLYETWGFHGGENVDYRILVCDVV
jgi:hypothetical protein